MPPVDPNAPPADPTIDDLFAAAVEEAIIDMGISLYQTDQLVSGVAATIKDEEAASS